MTDDRSRDTSVALAEIRTVHSRALSAIECLDGEWAGEFHDDPDHPILTRGEDESYDDWQERWRPWQEERLARRIKMADQDHDEMLAALQKVVELLEPWKKHGGRRRR